MIWIWIKTLEVSLLLAEVDVMLHAVVVCTGITRLLTVEVLTGSCNPLTASDFDY